MIARDGNLAEMIAAGARMLESSCGPCIGMGGAPATGHVSVRTYNRNFRGRCGNKDASVYLASPVVASLIALAGEMVDPFEAGIDVDLPEEPETYLINDNMLIPPSGDTSDVEIIKGPNIKEVPLKTPFSDSVEADVLLKLGDNITTDDIMPAGSAVLPFRSNIPAISEYVFYNIDSSFPRRALSAKESGGGIVVGGENYGQGSSREHAALAPMYLGLQAVIAKSFARIHRSNLINFGILPLVFKSPDDYEKINQGDRLRIENIKESLAGSQEYVVKNLATNEEITCLSNLNEREREIIQSGGLLSYARKFCTSQD
jgi:aconitate hydratase